MSKVRNTSQKQLILEAIKKLDHPTCEEIYEEVLKLDSSVGRATVFRNVKAMTINNSLYKVIMPQGALRYDLAKQDHSHFICNKCGKVQDVSYLPDIEIPESSSFDIDGYSLIFTGMCEKCRGKEG